MAIEIERKFLVTGTSWREEARLQASVLQASELQGPGRLLRQGYLSQAGSTTVRVRVDDSCGFLTVKGPSEGLRRAEFEYEIPLADALELLKLCHGALIEKLRYRVLLDGSCWEIDEFLGENAGLIVAEIELPAEDASFSRPAWLGSEVSDDPRYRNSNLVRCPFRSW
ncbi:MAG: CYTH domain-containing protein [Planctomycetaceae bacterium]|nr:CYTH domain-containing protein [Planctomycetaceae bacterium]